MARKADSGLRAMQGTFTAGELSPRLHARTDQALYQTGLALCRNFFVLPYGGVANRPGTKFVAFAGDEDTTHKVRLIPFRFSSGAGQNYILEFGDQYFRVFMDGAQVVYPPGDPDEGDPVEVGTPYQDTELEQLNWAQSADVMTLVHPSYAPRELSRADHHDWTLSTATFAPTLSAPLAADVVLAKGGAGTGTTWKYQVTWETETGEESLPGPVETQDHAATLTTTNYVGFTISNYPSGAVYANVYKYRGGSYGWIGSTADGSFTDDGISPQLEDAPPRARTPFSGSDNYPGATAYYQQRLAYAGSNNSPETLWLSQTGAYANFTTSEPLRDSDAITATLAGQQVDRIRHLVPMRSLLILGKGGVWSLDRGDTGLTPALEGGLNAQFAEGSSLLRPILAGTECLYVREGGHGVRAVDYSFERDGLISDDVSLLSEHLLRDVHAIDWTWAADPNRIVWIVRWDGALLSLSLLKEHAVRGWALHSTGAGNTGRFESVAAIPEDEGDGVYLVVRRYIGGGWRRCIERFAERTTYNVRDAYHVDCGLSLDSPIYISSVAVGGGFVTVTTSSSHGLAEGDLIDIEGIYGLEGLNDRRLMVGAPVTGTTFRVFQSGEDLESGVDTALPASEVTGDYLDGGSVREAVSTVSGLDHLEGEEVVVLADGSVEGPYTVDSGAITLLRPASRVHVGLAIEATIRTLPVASGKSAELRSRHKRITHIDLFLESSRGLWAGPTLDQLEEYIQRSDELLGDPTRLQSGRIELTVPSVWNEHGQIYVQTTDPLPVEILGIAPGLEFGS
jgi:hypothetical protein